MDSHGISHPSLPTWLFPVAARGCAEGYHEDVLPAAELQKLQEQLAGHPEPWMVPTGRGVAVHDWSIGKPWVLSLTAESLDSVDREFGFAGGEGFMVFKVPKSSVGTELVVSDQVESLAEHTRLEYRGSDPITARQAVKLSNICLRALVDEAVTGAPGVPGSQLRSHGGWGA
eukprot:Skav224970  [mRNA]  locus=scaffold3807:46892:48701:+ [translate_table: standard]